MAFTDRVQQILSWYSSENPGTLTLTPQRRLPRASTAARVSPAGAGAAAAARTRTATAKRNIGMAGLRRRQQTCARL